MKAITRKAVKRFRENLPSRIGALPRVDPFSGGRAPRSLTQTQELFIAWNAERLGVGLDESRERHLRHRTYQKRSAPDR